MAAPTYSTTALVCQKTKLGETDLILTLVADDGAQIRAVAKGARKPRSSFAARLELGSVCQLMLAKGRNLDIITECKLVQSHQSLREHYDSVVLMAPILEFLSKSTDVGLANDQLYKASLAALDGLEQFTTSPETNPSGGEAIVVAYLLKALAFSGFKPNFAQCAFCGTPVLTPEQSSENPGNLERFLQFSPLEGSVFCDACAPYEETIRYPRLLIQWAQALLYSRFDEILTMELDPSILRGLYGLLILLLQSHMQIRLKSLDYLQQNY